ncbi:MAG: TIM barrel protein [Elusimicrobia bacterium]|nr:TIM barrel protein [Elusimicrobiota bacterium]
MKNLLSLSTAYLIKKSKSWQNLIREAKLLNFQNIELSVEIPELWMKEIELSVSNNEIGISSLHNYCPALIGLPKNRTIYSGYLLTSDDENERKLALEYTLKTIEWAQRLNAKAVVIHAGEIETNPSGKEFFKYIKQLGYKEKQDSRYFEPIQISRKINSAKYLDRLMKGLDKILSFAQDKNIEIGLENRFYFNEIPNIEETAKIFETFPDAPLGYWHDTGHAEVFVRIGLVKNHLEYIKPFSEKLIGVHLHDIKGLEDHYAPGSGDFDFSILKPYLAEKVLRVIEAHTHSSSDEVKRSIIYLENAGLLS